MTTLLFALALTATATSSAIGPAPALAAPDDLDSMGAGLNASAGLLAPGLGSYLQGDAAGGAFQTFAAVQGLSFFIPTFADAMVYDQWYGPRRTVAMVSAAALFGASYLAGIVRGGRALPTSGRPRDALRVRAGVSTVAGARSEELDYYDSLVPTVGQQVRVGVMLTSFLEIFASGQSLYGDFDDSDDLGLSIGGGLTGYIPTGTIVSPYVGASLAYHPDSPLLGFQAGLAVELSPRIDLMVGGRHVRATADDFSPAELSFEVGFVQAF